MEVKGGKLAAKIVFDRRPSRREELRNQLTYVKRLPISDLPIAKPLRMLRTPDVGYVMELITGMVPLRDLAHPPKDCKSLAEWYISGGGLRRRLRILARMADALARLHGKGLVYGDPSTHNILVSEAVDASEVYLIDADNIRSRSDRVGSTIYTPGFGAPELLDGSSGVTTLTDAHAFAVIVFQVLALTHPLMGDSVVDGSPELEAQALLGELPWVDDEVSDTNRSSYGVPRDMVFSDRLRDLCSRTFASGLRTPKDRPGIAEWAERLLWAADATLSCASCKGTFYFNAEACPWCDELPPAYVMSRIAVLSPEGKQLRKDLDDEGRAAGQKPTRTIGGFIVGADESICLTQRHVTGTSGPDAGLQELTIAYSKGRLSISSNSNETYTLTHASRKRSEKIDHRIRTIQIQEGACPWVLHLGPPDKVHRVVTFHGQKGTRP